MPIDLDQVTRSLAPVHLRSIVESTARINIWEGSVRSGKTVSSLLRFLIAVASAPTSGRILIFGKTRESINRNVFAVLQDPALFGSLALLTHYNAGAPTATILGREVDVIGASDAKAEPKVRGMTLCLAYGDELTTLPEAFFSQVLARLSVRGAQLFGTTNPDSRSHWLRQKYLLRVGELNLRTWHSTIDDNPHLDPDYVRDLKSEFTGLWYRRFILGEWVAAEGAIFDMFDDQVHVVTDRQMPHIQRWISMGVDHGTRNPLHALLLGLGTDRNLYITREWRWDSKKKRRQLSVAQYADELRNWLRTAPIPGTQALGITPERTVVDPSALELRVMLHQSGIATMVADNAVLPSIQALSSLFSLNLLRIHDSCTELLDEIPGYSWDDDSIEEQPVKDADHGIDAMRYAAYSTRSIWRPLLRHQLILAA